MIEIQKSETPFVAHVTGASLGVLEDEAIWDEIREAWAQYPVLCFPNQKLSTEELEQVTTHFGGFGVDQFIDPMEGHPHVIEIKRAADERVKPFAADSWHSDWSFYEEPPAGTLLYGITIPPVGGDTLFADCTAAFDALPPEQQRELESMRVLHSAILGYSTKGAFADDGKERSMTIRVSEDAEARHAHPMVRVHPVTKRKTLFINPVYSVGIEGMEDADAAAFLGPLYAHLLQPQFQYRHKWSKDMLLLWDNRRVIHAASGGYDGHARLLRRTTIAGEAVIPA